MGLVEVSVVIVALLTAGLAVLAFLLYRETVLGRRAGDHLARLGCRVSQRSWSVLKSLAVLVLLYVQTVRHGGSRP